jgi:MFS family permease
MVLDDPALQERIAERYRASYQDYRVDALRRAAGADNSKILASTDHLSDVLGLRASKPAKPQRRGSRMSEQSGQPTSVIEDTGEFPYDPDEIVTVHGVRMRKARYIVVLMVIMCAAWFLVNFDTAITGAAGPALIHAFHISPQALLYLTSVSGAAGLVAAITAGYFVDRIGRKRVFALSLAFVGVFSGLVAAVAVFWQFVVLRCLATLTFGGINGAQTTLLAEEASPRQRGRLQGLAWLFLAFGAAIAGTVAGWVLTNWGWRQLFLLAFAPVLLVIFLTRFVRESPRFLQIRKDHVSTAKTTHKFEIRRDVLRRLFSRGQWFQTTCLMLMGLFSSASVTYTYFVAPVYLVERLHFSQAAAADIISIMSWSAVAGNIPAGWLADKISPKYVMVLFEALGAVLIAPLPITGARWSVYLAFIGMGFFVQCGYVGLAVYMPGAFRTHMRGTAIGVIIMAVYVGQIVIPLIAGSLINLSNVMIPLLMLSLPVIALLASACLRYMPPGQEIEKMAERMSAAADSKIILTTEGT